MLLRTRTSLLPLSTLALLGASTLGFAQGGPGGPPPIPPIPPVVSPPENPTTPEKVVLGKMLFWDEQLSTDNTISCGTCHIPSSGGGDPRSSSAIVNPGFDGNFGTPDDVHGSPGVIRADAADNYESDPSFEFDEQVTGRTAPSMIGAAFSNTLFWDGRATGQFVNPTTNLVSIANGGALESQAVGPILSDVEMAHVSRDWPAVLAKLDEVQPLRFSPSLTPDIVTALTSFPTYADLFANAFGTPVITVERIAFAIAAYQRTLVPNQAPIDAFIAGNQNALTQQQRNGLGAFSGPGRCVVCHAGPLFTNNSFRNVGLRPPVEDLGRQVVTGNPNDRGRFKVPTLRNVALRDSFFHNGERTTLNEVLAFYAGGGIFPDNRDPVMAQINLPPQARNDIVALMSALTDPRVANELPPFDRPALRSEAPRGHPVPLGGAIPGTGGFVPQMIATSPPATGATGFKLGIANALGGAQAMLVLKSPFSAPSQLASSTPRAVSLARLPRVTLNGIGTGQGFGTVHLDIPELMALNGMKVEAQWYVADPAAVGGYARTEVFELTIQ